MARATDHCAGGCSFLGAVLPIVLLYIIVDAVIDLVVLVAAHLSAHRSGSGAYCGAFHPTTGNRSRGRGTVGGILAFTGIHLDLL
ncbi:hypothetical protein D3C77_764430 [compost metagenome]